MTMEIAKGILELPGLHLTHSERAVYIALAAFSDHRNLCSPSNGEIAKHASCSVATLKRALNRLHELELVMWECRFDENEKRLRKRYIVLPPAADAVPAQSFEANFEEDLS